MSCQCVLVWCASIRGVYVCACVVVVVAVCVFVCVAVGRYCRLYQLLK